MIRSKWRHTPILALPNQNVQRRNLFFFRARVLEAVIMNPWRSKPGSPLNGYETLAQWWGNELPNRSTSNYRAVLLHRSFRTWCPLALAQADADLQNSFHRDTVWDTRRASKTYVFKYSSQFFGMVVLEKGVWVRRFWAKPVSLFMMWIFPTVLNLYLMPHQ